MKKLLKRWHRVKAVFPLPETKPPDVDRSAGTESNFGDFSAVSTTSELFEEAESEFNKTIYFLSLINRFIGIGNLWRFSFLALIHNGGSFLVCYFILLLTVGVPMYLLETSLGQFTSKGLLRAFHCIYIMNGLRYAMALVSFYSGAYYSVLNAYLLKYLLFSFPAKIPWTLCRDDLTEYTCIDLKSSRKHPCETRMIDCENAIFSTENFWIRHFLEEPTVNGEASKASVKNEVVAFVAMVWIVLFGMLLSPLTVSGKVVYFSSTVPYLLVCMLLVNNCFLPGMQKGLFYLLTPSLIDFTDAKIWKAAASQVLISLMICSGGLIHMSSFNSFQNNCFIDTFMITGFNSLISVIMAATVFSFIGHQASIVNSSISDLLLNNTAVPFIGFSGAVSSISRPHLWSILFYSLFTLISLSNLFWATKAVFVTLRKYFPDYIKSRLKFSVGAVCGIYFIITFIFTQKESQERIYFFDYYAVAYPLIVIAIVETLSISYIYGIRMISTDIKMMTGHEPPPIICKMWSIITPLMLIIILVANIIQEKGLKLGEYKYSIRENIFGWFLFLSCVILIPIKAIINVRKQKETGITRLKVAMKPHRKWHPHRKDDRVGKYAEDNETANRIVPTT